MISYLVVDHDDGGDEGDDRGSEGEDEGSEAEEVWCKVGPYRK